MQEGQMITRLILMMAVIAGEAAAQYPSLVETMMPFAHMRSTEQGLAMKVPPECDGGSTMIKIFAAFQTSLAGFIERAKREVDWVMANDGEEWAETPVFNTSRF